MTEIISVSIKPEHKKFLAQTRFSASKLLQQAINELMNDYNNVDLKGLIDIQKKRNAALMETIAKMNDFLNQNSLLDAYFNETTKKEAEKP
jgi:hypothetical protein